MPTTSTNLSMPIPVVGSDTDTWGGYLNTSLTIIDGIFVANGSGTSVGLNVGTGKTLNVTGTATINSTSSTIDGAVIGGTTPAAGTFTTLACTTPTLTTDSTQVATTAYVKDLVQLNTPAYKTSSGNESVPSGATRAQVVVVGGGATGQGAAASGTKVYGGGSGAVAIWNFAVTAGQTLTWTVGAGVNATSGSASAGTAGNSSSVTYGSDSITAGGGFASGSTGAGGTVSTGGAPANYLSIPGQCGGSIEGKTSAPRVTGFSMGGSTQYGRGGPSAFSYDALDASVSSPDGVGYGSGGSGHLALTVGALNPGDGKQGLVIVTYLP